MTTKKAASNVTVNPADDRARQRATTEVGAFLQSDTLFDALEEGLRNSRARNRAIADPREWLGEKGVKLPSDASISVTVESGSTDTIIRICVTVTITRNGYTASATACRLVFIAD